MQTGTISDIYANNKKVRQRLLDTISTLSDEQIYAKPGEEKWSIAQILDHISIVNGGMYRICEKLLSKAKANEMRASGLFDVEGFRSKAAGIANVKLEAPEFVKPAAARPVKDSIQALNENAHAFDEIREMFEEFDSDSFKFPHPFLGELSAAEWLMMAGGHEARHLAQIGQIIEKLDPATS